MAQPAENPTFHIVRKQLLLTTARDNVFAHQILFHSGFSPEAGPADFCV
jgi:hypothetical protein